MEIENEFCWNTISWRHENGSKGFEAKENRRGGGLMFKRRVFQAKYLFIIRQNLAGD
ncbi:hypothetical protein [Avibacterium paragallinarum]|uniref:hypothetical protein n=1 Tax=Avibacterium paragallinarum TaxID=728 RepID=UPI0015F275C9|nr:hypothetical protein [Avibacterium paragallinarum]